MHSLRRLLSSRVPIQSTSGSACVSSADTAQFNDTSNTYADIYSKKAPIFSNRTRDMHLKKTGILPKFPDEMKMSKVFAPNHVVEPYNVAYFMFSDELAMRRSRVWNATNYNLLVRIQEWLTLVERKPALWSAVWRGDHKNFSAGDDLQEIYEDKFKYEDTMRFDYYTLQFDISWYLLNMKTKVIPYLSGASVGPTLGYAAMSDYAVCTDTTQAMVPSAAYGFVPTAGSSWLLSRLKGQLGIYMAMTAETLKGSHAFYAGIGRYYIPADRADNLAMQMNSAPMEGAALDYFISSLGDLPVRDDSFEELLYRVDSVFLGDSVEEFMHFAQEKGELDWYNRMKSFSPTSLRLSLEMIQRARTMSKEQVLDMEKNVVFKLLEEDEFYEGIRGSVMDPDHPPQWTPVRHYSEYLEE